MKKNVMLGLVALFCAFGSAIASKLLVPSPTWIKGTTIAGIPTCSTLGNLCDPQAGSAVNCRIVVTLANGTTKATVGYSTQSSNVCTVPRLTPSAYTANKPNLSNVETYF